MSKTFLLPQILALDLLALFMLELVSLPIDRLKLEVKGPDTNPISKDFKKSDLLHKRLVDVLTTSKLCTELDALATVTRALVALGERGMSWDMMVGAYKDTTPRVQIATCLTPHQTEKPAKTSYLL